MTSNNLENLASIGKLKRERTSQSEFDGLVQSGRRRLADARVTNLSLEGRFDLAYNASHALSLAALRWHGYRSDSRYLVFQCLPFTLGMEPAQWRLLSLCHERRNLAEYEGHLDVEEKLVAELIDMAEVIAEKVEALGELT
ncbi:MAG: hypothetical protein GXP30_11990 [Verrucomicrobia bacterium]|nr:hypothetical protein [Verrucomicrobiota bacterium]